MFLGPIVHKEVVDAARRPRTYLVRVLASAAIAAYVAMRVEGLGGRTASAQLTPGRVAVLAHAAFVEFAYAQGVVVVALVPVLVAGAIVEEKGRGTLGLLLVSRLSSAEIVTGKLASRALLALMLIAAGLPVLSLVGLHGGIEPAQAIACYGVTLATAGVAAALAMVVSVHARSTVGATIGTYAAVLGWLVVPVALAATLASPRTPAALAKLRPVVAGLARSSPLSIGAPFAVWGPSAGSPSALSWMVPEMAALEVGFALGLVALAGWRLRPVARAQAGGGPGGRRGWLARVAGLRPPARPPCGDDPMRWKEDYGPEFGGIARLVILVALTLIAYQSIQRLRASPNPTDQAAFLAFNELLLHGVNLNTVEIGASHGLLLPWVC